MHTYVTITSNFLSGQLPKRKIMSRQPVEHIDPKVKDDERKWNEPLASLIKDQKWFNLFGCNLTELPVTRLLQERPPVAALNLDCNHLLDLPSELGHIVSLVSISINSQTAAPRASISKGHTSSACRRTSADCRSCACYCCVRTPSSICRSRSHRGARCPYWTCD